MIVGFEFRQQIMRVRNRERGASIRGGAWAIRRSDGPSFLLRIATAVFAVVKRWDGRPRSIPVDPRRATVAGGVPFSSLCRMQSRHTVGRSSHCHAVNGVSGASATMAMLSLSPDLSAILIFESRLLTAAVCVWGQFQN